MITVRTLGSEYKPFEYKPVCTKYILFCLFLYRRVHTRYMLTLMEYVLLVSDFIARLAGRPAGLLGNDSGTGPRIEPNHTQALAGLFTAAWQHPCQSLCLSAWALALGDSAAAGQLHPTRSHHDQLSAQQQHQPQPAMQCALRISV